MRLPPLFPYYGSAHLKTTRGVYPPPRHSTIVEPFAGSAGYSLHYPDRRVVLVDTDPRVVGVWRYLLRTPGHELRRLPDIEPDHPVDDLCVCQEARWLIGFWLGRCRARPARSGGSWYAKYRASRPLSFWSPDVRDRLAHAVGRVRHWQIVEGSYEQAERIVRGKRTSFVDPPYQGKPGRRYAHGCAGLDFADLAAFCRRQRGQTIVCEARGATWLPFHAAGAARSQTGSCREALCVLHDGRVVEPRQPSLALARSEAP